MKFRRRERNTFPLPARLLRLELRLQVAERDILQLRSPWSWNRASLWFFLSRVSPNSGACCWCNFVYFTAAGPGAEVISPGAQVSAARPRAG